MELLMNYRRALLAFGNGKISRGRQVLFMLAHRLEHARAKHPWPDHALGAKGAYAALMGEAHELGHAMENETRNRVIDEGLDTAAVSIRIINDEHNAKGKNP